MENDSPRGLAAGSARVNGHAFGVNRFVAWDQSTLAQYAFEATERIKELEADLKDAMEAYRTLLRNQ